MKQNPNNLKFKKYHKPVSSYLSLKAHSLFLPRTGFYGLKAVSSGRLRLNEIEAARRTIRRTIGRLSSIWVNVFTYASITKKPVAARMGKGKGAHSHWVCPVREGQILFEISNIDKELAIRSLLKAGSKLSLRTKIVNILY